MSEGWGGTADFEKDGFCFRLQDYYVKDWAENFMIVLNVQDVAAWYQKMLAVANDEELAGSVHVKPPEPVGNAMVMHVIDPAGVCLIFVQ